MVYPVAPLPLGSAAEELFRDRAELAHQVGTDDAATVADLCSRLDGLPLAIELAAARSASLGATGLLTGLGDYLRLLAGGRGSVVRHRSLRGVIGWSHDLLTEDERTVFRRLSVFVGDFDLPAAAAVTGVGAAGTADVLGRLVDKSLVQHRDGSWRLLDTIRAFAAEHLAIDPEQTEMRRRYLRWAAGVATDLAGRAGAAWHAEFDAVAGDRRAALTGNEQPDAEAHRLARALGRLTFARGHLWQAPGLLRARRPVRAERGRVGSGLGQRGGLRARRQRRRPSVRAAAGRRRPGAGRGRGQRAGRRAGTGRRAGRPVRARFP